MGTFVSESSMSLAAGLRPILMRLDLVVRRTHTHYSLSRTQTSILSTLADHGDLRMTDLARIENVRVPTTSNSVSIIEGMGLVERAPDPADRRGVVVRLTETGRQQIDDALARRNRELAGKIDQLDPSHRQALSASIPALLALLSDYEELEEEE